MELEKRLSSIEKKLNKITFSLITTKESSNLYFAQLKKNVTGIFEEARKVFTQWAIINIPNAYNEALREHIKEVKAKIVSFSTPREINYTEQKESQISSRKRFSILDMALDDYLLGLDSGMKSFYKLIRFTQQINITEKELDKSIVKGFRKTQSLRGAKEELRKKLIKNALDKKYISIVDKNGKTRKYNIKYYASLVARTKTREANTNAVIDVAIGFGSDLVQVSSHNTETLYDKQFEGKIFSLSGKSKRFPPVIALPPFHPNCIHNITVFFEKAHTEAELKKVSDFSMGKIEKHPTLPGHNPKRVS